MKGGRASKGAGDIYRSRTLQQTPTYDGLNGVTGWVERKGIGIHAWYAAGASRAWWCCSQTGGDTGGDAGCQRAPHWENTQYVLFGL